MRWVMVSTMVLLFAGVSVALMPVERPATGTAKAGFEPAPAVAEQAQLDDRQLDAIADRLAARMAVRHWHSDPAAPAAQQPADTVAPEAPREVTGDQRAVADRAGQIVDQAIARRELGMEDVMALRQLGRKLPPGAQDELRLKMIRALNRQELKLDPRAGLP